MTESSAPAVRSRWRLAYVPGDWLALAGPNAAVVLQPASPQWSELIATIWQDVLSATSIDDLLQRMASFRLEGMPNFAAFFWSAGELHSLVRGGVQVFDHSSGTMIADGARIHTWTESVLAGIDVIQVRLTEPNDERRLELPLVVGVAGVSSLILDTRPDRQVELESAEDPELAVTPAPDEAALSKIETAEIETAGIETAEIETADDQAETDLTADSPGTLDLEPPAAAATVPVGPAAETMVEPLEFDEAEDGRTLLAPSLPGAPQLPPPAPPTRVVVAILIPSSGGRVEVDRPILVGRSPSASRVSGDLLPRLLTVPSPSHDISRTHLQVAPGDGQVVLTDLNSTNGTILIKTDGEQVMLEPSSPLAVDFGSVVDLGDGVTIRVDAPVRA